MGKKKKRKDAPARQKKVVHAGQEGCRLRKKKKKFTHNKEGRGASDRAGEKTCQLTFVSWERKKQDLYLRVRPKGGRAKIKATNEKKNCPSRKKNALLTTFFTRKKEEGCQRKRSRSQQQHWRKNT